MLKKLIALFAIVGLLFVQSPKLLTADAASVNFGFSSVNFYSSYWGFQSVYVGLNGSRKFVIEITGCDTAGCQLTQSPGYGAANIAFFNSSYVQTTTRNLSTLISTSNANGVYVLDLDVLAISPTPSYFRITIPYAYVGSNPYLSLVNNSYYDLWPTDYVKTVKFVSNLTTVYTTTFVGYVSTYPSDPTAPSGYMFDGWYDSEGNLYGFNTAYAVADDKLIDNIFYLYARFKAIPPTDLFPDTGGGDPLAAVMTLLAAYGLDSDGGRTFLYVVFLILINGVIYWYLKVNALVAVSVSLAITILFMFIGILPLPVSIIMISLFLLTFLMTFNKGGLTNE